MPSPLANHHLPTIDHLVDVCVVGGGLAGICAAIAAARRGARTLILQDRPMFGGNASSEIRMWVCGAHGLNNRETGLIEEILLENFYRNPWRNYSIWDSILFEKVRFQPGLDYLLNCSCLDAALDGSRIRSVTGWQTTTQSFHRVSAGIFIDCSGDSILAPLTGAEYRQGRESRQEFGESIAPATADRQTMGMSCLIQARETEQKREFIAPFWAEKFTREKLPNRQPHPLNPSENYWYLELGGEQDTIADTEQIRDQLQDVAFGMWDYIKNSGEFPAAAERLDLDWIGILPGKRESRRYVGDYILNQNDVRAEGRFDDIVAYGGWSMDDHVPGGLRSSEPPTIFHPAPSPYGIPYRCLYSRNIDNLMFAGRNISVTHTAMSSTRVMATCATLGQAAGTAAALAVRSETTPRGVFQAHLRELQVQLQSDDCYLPFNRKPIPELTRQAELRSDRPDAENLRNGLERPIGAADNGWLGKPGSYAAYHFAVPTAVSRVRLVFDSDLNRETLPEADKRLNRPTKSQYFRDDIPACVPQTLVREFRIEALNGRDEWQLIREVTGNHQRLVVLPVDAHATAIRFVPQATWGSADCHVFAFEVE